MKVKSYKELIVWQKSMELTREVYTCTEKFPKSEMFGLINQMRRATVSIPSNIAEGFGRAHTKEYLHFLHTAHGSLNELETQIVLSKDMNFLTETEFIKLNGYIDEISRMLYILEKTLVRNHLSLTTKH
jgi:four helix bundle protein